MTKITMTIILAVALCACQHKTNERDVKMDRFVNHLMEQMTLEEKIGQLNLLSVGFDITGPILSQDVNEKIRRGLVGGVFNTYTPDAVRKLQDIAVNETRLKIPLLFGFDVIHGHRTIFPIPLGLSASWDMDLIERTARVAAEEATADGLCWTFSPMVDITRDPRWGRVSEGSGEDPYLGSQIARAMVKGYEQGDLSQVSTLMSCVKHFAMYGASEGGRDYNTVDMSHQRMYNEYLPPYKAAVEAGTGSLMPSFNEVDGIPATGNKWLLTDVLRHQWGFDGLVVSDYTAVMEMMRHGMGDEAMVAELALNAGVDMDMVSEMFVKEGASLAKEKRVSETTINAACRRVLEAKYKLRLFDDPYRYIDGDRAKTQIMSENKLALSEEAAEKSIVLLKNDHQLLPLDASKKIAFIGPHVKGKRDLIGNWSGAGDWKKAVSLWDGLDKKFGTGKFLYAQGCNMLEDKSLIGQLNQHGAMLEMSTKSSGQLIDEAVQTARKADVIVVALGETFGMSGEAACRTNIGLPGNQVELLKALKTVGKPIVLIVMNGRPLTLEWEDKHMDAILETWFAGTRTGNAIAHVLFGDVNPSGKLTMTFPRNVGQIPVYYNHKNTGRPMDEKQKFTSKYLDAPNEPLYPFGYGLSYTTFIYSGITLSSPELKAGGTLRASVTITNSGKWDGMETVQLYIRDMVGTVTRPVKELKGFQKVVLKAGESKMIDFEIGEDDLMFYNYYLEHVVEPGEFRVFIGGNSRDVQEAVFIYHR